MAQFSFDIVSDYDKAEMNNVFDQVQREIANRYDFKGTPAATAIGKLKLYLKLSAKSWQRDLRAKKCSTPHLKLLKAI
jgi:uncharacterized protein YajQ (UPF0234 family)